MAVVQIKISKGILSAVVSNIENKEKNLYAFYLFMDDIIQEKRKYSDSLEAEWPISDRGGVYRVAAFIRSKYENEKPEIVSSEEVICFKGEAFPFIRIEEMEMTNYCNLSCTNCCTPTTRYHRGYIDDRTVLMTLAWTKKGQTLNYHRQGEALLHRKLEKYIRWGVEIGIKPVISTNGILLTRKRLESLYESGLRHLEITLHTSGSIDAFQMACDFFKEKKVKVVHFSRRHEKFETEVMFFAGKVLDFIGENQELSKKIENMKEKYGEYLQYTPSHTWAGNVKGTRQEFSDTIVSNRRENCYFINKKVVNVRWDGSVVGCCFDSENINEIGHISKFNEIRIDLSKYHLCRHCDSNWAVNGGNPGM